MTSGSGELSGAWNFRDVAEQTGVRPGLFYRSSQLSRLDEVGRRAFRELGIRDVADLRSPREVERQGAGAVPEDVEVHLLPFPDLGADEDAPHDVSFQRVMTEIPDDADVEAEAKRYMIEVYEEFPTLAGARRAVQRVVTLLAERRSVIAHCYAGKDRTGFTVAVVLEALGVEPDVVLADFLASNTAIPRLRERIMDSMASRLEGLAGHGGHTGSVTAEMKTFAEARLTDAVLGVREEYLAVARRTIDREFGSLAGFLQATGVTGDDLTRLRAALLD